MNPQTKTMIPATIHPETQMGPVTLRVADLKRSADFYLGVLGFRRVEEQAGTLVLGSADGTPLLTLLERPGARPMPRRASGLYHFAILLPTRADLGRMLRRLAEAGIEIGSADHLVSEALYISDPDGNGIEIYRDRPRAGWQWDGNTVRMATDPIDVQGLLAEAARDSKPGEGLPAGASAPDSRTPSGRGGAAAAGEAGGFLPAGTRMGHVHLQVSDIAQALAFYRDLLGFELTAQFQGAAFISAGKYHHHMGLNTWQSRGAGPAPAGSAGLETLVIEVPDRAEQERLVQRLADAGLAVTKQEGRVSARDPWNNEVVLAVRQKEPGL